MRSPRFSRHLLISTLALAAACGRDARDKAAHVSADIAEFAAAATGHNGGVGDAVKAQGFLGFDTGTYPGDKAMRAWRTGGAPYEWTGFYLQAPCHPDNGWSGKRETLTSMGYGIAVVYVGQQTWGRVPGAPHFIPVQVSSRVKTHVGRGTARKTAWRTVTRTILKRAPKPTEDETCNADFVSADRGKRDAYDAIARTSAEGFARGTKIFLDLERMDVMPPAMREYYRGWVQVVLADGRYRPGIYVHTFNANTVFSDVKGVYTSLGRTEDPPFWVAKSRGFDVTKLPSEMGHAFAAVWQGVLDVEQTWAGHKIPIDVNVSGSRSPSD